MGRTKIRTYAFKILYSLEIQKLDKSELEEQIDLFLEEQEREQGEEKQDEEKQGEYEKAKEYVTNVIYGVAKEQTEIEKLISESLNEKWNIERISKIDKALLKLSVYELIYTDLPYKIVVDEVVKLAKKYGDDNSSSFINGVLANIIKKKGLNNDI